MPPVPSPTHSPARSVYETIVANIETVIKGQRPALRRLLAAFASGGHVLLIVYRDWETDRKSVV